MFAQHVVATVVALSWKRTVVIEHGRWRSRRTAWKPHGDNIRNLRSVRSTEFDIVSDNINVDRAGTQPGKRYRLKVSTLSGEIKQVGPLTGSWR